VAAALVAAAGFTVWLVTDFAKPFPHPEPRIYTAARIVTMNPAHPRAEAVAVADGNIVAVGSLEEVRAATVDLKPTIDSRFSEKVMMPGFIDPHLHPSLAATILPLNIVSAMEWMTPRGRSKAVRGREAFLDRLRELNAAMQMTNSPSEWLLAWGYHEPYHGALSREDLDAVSSTRPIMVWQRSVHEMFFNTAGLASLGLTEEMVAAHEHANWADGHLWETAVLTLAAPMMKILAWPPTYREGLSMMRDVIHRGGLTTVAEQGFPQITSLGELAMLHLEMRKPSTPFRFVLVPNAMYLVRTHGNADNARTAAADMLTRSTERVRIVKHIKYYADGAIFSQLMQMSQAYLDGHHGEWMMPPDVQRSVLDAFWDQGWAFHIHVNGDAGLDLVLDQIEAKTEVGKASPRIVLEHYGYARHEQHERVAKLGIDVSNNAYYLHELAPIYAQHGLGPERAASISPLGGAARAGVPISFHSDFPMAPAEPLTLVWVAVNRIASDGKVWGENQKLSLELALRAITIEAARSLGLENEIGSIEVGKKADFTILERDPHDVPPHEIKDIPIWGTVLEGQPTPLQE
jgi:predicted amidohydrolase YtcJ